MLSCALLSGCVGGEAFVGPAFEEQLGIIATFPTTSADLQAVDRVVARAVAPPNRIVGRFERALEANEEEMEILLDVDLASAPFSLRIEVELIASGVVVYSGAATGAISDVAGRAWTVELEPSVPVLEISTDEVRIVAEQGGAVAGATIDVRNRGTDGLEWSAESSVNWLRVERDGNSFRVIASPTDLPVGRSEAWIRVAAPRALDAPQDIRVVVEVVGGAASARLRVRGQGGGGGFVGSSPAGIRCAFEDGADSGVCENEFAPGSEVVLVPTAVGTSTFRGWSGDCGGTGECRVRMDTDRSVRAHWSTESSAAPLQSVVISRSLIEAEGFAGAGRLDAARLTLRNPNDQKVHWRATSSAPWLRLVPHAGSLEAGEALALVPEVKPGDLEPGIYRAEVVITTSSGSATPVSTTVPVALHIREAETGGALSVDRVDISFESRPGGGVRPNQEDFELRNPGGTAVRWRADADQAWLSLSTAEGTLTPGERARIRVAVNPSALPAGDFEARIRIVGLSDEGVVDTSVRPQEIVVRLHVDAGPDWSAVLLRSAYGTTEGSDVEDGGGTVRITNAGGADVRWQLSASEKWVEVSRRPGILEPGNSVDVPFTVTGGDLPVGTHTAEVRVRSLGSAFRDVVLRVEVVVSAAGGP